jgi:lipid-binding SYLF domain-containing protein
MKFTTTLGGAIALAAMFLIGCQTAPKTEAAKADLEQDAQTAVSRMTSEEPAIQEMIDKGYGYVIFPNAGKGGLIVGGAYGRGIVYEQGRQIGFADITQLSAGAQIGGQAFSELIVFENKESLDRFRNNQLTFAANASAVIVKKGVAAANRFENGVAVYVMPKAGAMAEAAVGGQKFTFTPSSGSGQPATRPAQKASASESSSSRNNSSNSTDTDSSRKTETETTKTEIKTETKTTD